MIHKTDIHVGDIVVSYANILEVIKINKNAFGYKSYPVKFIGSLPLPGLQKDEFQAKNVKLFDSRKRLSKK